MKPVIPLSTDRGQFVDSNDFSWTALAKASYGLELVRKPFTPNNPWIMNNMRNMFQFALGFVPSVGFVLQIAFALGWTAISDPDDFYEAVKSNVPGFISLDANQAASPFQIPRTQIKDAVDTTDKNPALQTQPVVEGASFKKGDKVLQESANKPPPLVQVNV
ncbi:MAG: hypothetical protein Q9167_004852 [Letrouitia subvulpina]